VTFSFFLVLTVGWLFAAERRQGTFVRLRAAPITRGQLLLGKFLPALAVAMLLTAAIGVVVERVALRRLYGRDHLYQVLATFGLILFLNEVVAILFGPQPIFASPPPSLSGQVELFGAPYPAFRLAIIIVGALTALCLWGLINRTRLGMLIRASADNREMASALGVDVAKLYTAVFALGAALAALAGAMAGPVLAVRIGMGEDILILTFVVIVIGGIGSVRGALAGALLVGLVDTFGRAFLPAIMGAAGAALASMTIYIVMALVLAFRPRGLFPAPG